MDSLLRMRTIKRVPMRKHQQSMKRYQINKQVRTKMEMMMRTKKKVA